MKLRNGIGFLLVSLIFLSGAAAQESGWSLQPEPGSYPQDQILTFRAEEGFRILYTFSSAGEPDIPYAGPLVLSALPGEERIYSLTAVLMAGDREADRKELRYVIDRKAPAAPLMAVPEGIYHHSLSLKMETDASSKTVYGISGAMNTPLQVWQGEEIRLPGGEAGDAVYSLSAYSVDPAGNRSAVRNWSYTIVSPGDTGTDLEILSPRAGEYANSQLLYLKESGYRWIRYSLNGSDPVLAGSEYSGPVVLRRTGDVVLKITAQPEGTGDTETYEIRYRVAEQAPRLGIPESGVYSSSLSFHSAESAGFYCLEDRSPDYPDPSLSGDIQVRDLPRGIRETPLRIRLSGREDLPEYRYYYILDSRVPADPKILSDQMPPLTGNAQIRLSGSDFAPIYYTLDGSSPDLNSHLYQGPFTLALPEDPSSGSLIVKARAFSKNGSVSGETSRLFTYNRSTPAVPSVQVSQPDPDGPAVITASAPDSSARVLYRISSLRGDLLVNKNSPVFPGTAVLDVPRGQENTFYMVFAVRDSAGNLSETTAPREIRINRRSTLPPVPEYRDGNVILYGAGNLFYRLEEDLSGGETPADPQVKPYTQPFRLAAGELVSRKVTVRAWAEDSAGRRSAEAVLSVELPAGMPPEPEYSGILPGEVTGKKTAVLYLKPLPEGNEILYALSTGGTPVPEISESSSRAADSITFRGIPDQETEFHLVLKSRSRTTGLYSHPVTLDFTMDLQNPGLPSLAAPAEGAVVSGQVRIEPAAETENRIYLSHTSDGTQPPDPFGESGTRLFGGRTFTGPDGEETRISYRIGVEDPAGNRLRDEVLHWFVIDNRRPALPALQGLPPEGITSGPVTLSCLLDRGDRLFYEMSTDGRQPGEVTESSPVLPAGGLRLEGRSGSDQTVMIRYRVLSSSGAWSSLEGAAVFLLDRTAPGTPGEPKIRIQEDSRRLFVTWDVQPETELYFRIPELNAQYFRFDEPAVLSYPEGRDRLTIESYLADRAGNRSETRTSSVYLPTGTFRELVKGYPSGGLTNSLVRLYKAQNAEFLRYEVGTEENPPGPVSVFSPVFPKSIDLEAGQGEALDYILRVRSFADAASEMGGDEQILRFTVDRRIPGTPEILGAGDGEHYQEDLTLSFREQGSDVYYAVQKGAPGDNPGEPQYQKFIRPFEVRSREGTFDTYRILAYARSASGNQSEVREWSFTIDREIIYVSPEGDDLFDGTRTRPFRSLEKAVAYSGETGRKTLFLARGTLELEQPLLLGDISLEGGKNSRSWETAAGGETVITPGDTFPAGRSLLRVSGQGAARNIALEAERGNADGIFRLEGGSWELKDTRVLLTGGFTGRGVVVTAGKLDAENLQIDGQGFGGPALVSVRGGELLVTGSRMERRNNTGNSLLMSVESGGSVRLLGTEMYPGNGRSTRAVQVDGGSLWIDGRTMIDCGGGSVDSQGISARNGDITVINSLIRGNASGRTIQGIYGEDSEILVQDSSIRIEAASGAVAVQARNSRFLILGSRLYASAREFVYLIRLEQSSGRAYNNYMRTGPTRDLIGVSLDASVTGWFQNTMIFQAGSRSHFGFSSRNSDDLNILNNILISDAPGLAGTAVQAETENIRLQGNDLHGWQILYRRPSAGLQAGSVNTLNGLDGQPSGGPFQGNIDENPLSTFIDAASETPKLKSGSACVNGGMDLSLNRDLLVDYDKQRRPNPQAGTRQGFDIGADEYYP